MRIDQIETPALVADLDVLEKNMETMDRWLSDKPYRLRPHYKSTKCPAIVRMQFSRGAKGITCAKLSEAEDLVKDGAEDILIANQVTSPEKIARLAYLANCCRLTVCADSAENVEDLQKACALSGAVLSVLVEYDVGMDRCGVNTFEDFLFLAKKIDACPNLRFEGIQAYAGNLAHEENGARRKAEAKKVEETVKALKAFVENNGVDVKEVSGISTGTIAFHESDSVYTEAQAGSYVFSDTSYKAVGVDFENALFVLATVMSTHRGAAITDAGLKSVSVDQRMPAFQGYEKYHIEMSEEHCALYGNDLNLKTGDKLKLIPSHCCTTINMYDYLYFVRGGKVVCRERIEGRGHSL